MRTNISVGLHLLKYGFCFATVVWAIAGCGKSTKWGTAKNTIPEEYKIQWLETLPMKEVRWAVPRWQREGKMFLAGQLTDDSEVESIIRAAKTNKQFEVFGFDPGPKVTDVLNNGVLAKSNPSPGIVYWIDGKFAKRFMRMTLDSKKHVTGMVFLTGSE